MNPTAAAGPSKSTLNNCTLSDNLADYGGGAFEGTLNNCIVYYNNARLTNPNYLGGTFNHCCTTPVPSGHGNLTNAPAFVNANGWSTLRLQSNSPCINAGNNSYVLGARDLDGNLRIAGDTVDIGAYEFQSPASLLSYAWLQRYGFPTDGSADYIDLDADGYNNWLEWLAGSDPTNAQSAGPRLLSQPASLIIIVGRSVTLSVTASGTLPLRYQWRFNGTDNLPFATNAVLTLTHVQPADMGEYSVSVSNIYGSVVSSNALLLSPGQAVLRLMTQVTSAWARHRSLLATLSAALASIEQNNCATTLNTLLAFQNQTQAQVAPSAPNLAAALMDSAQQIINALSGCDDRRGGRFTSLARQPDGAVRLQFFASPGSIGILEASTNLVHWEMIGLATEHADGTFTVEDPEAPKYPNRFYRIVMD